MNGDKINGRTPAEIKRMLRCLSTPCAGECEECEHNVGEPDFTPYDAYVCALELIQQLERERDEARNDLDTINYANTELHSAYEAMKRERDAAVELLHGFCGACANEGKHEICVECSRRLPFEPDDKDDYWQWRGVQEVE